MTKESRSKSLKSIFERKGGIGRYTLIFNQMQGMQQQVILQKVSLTHQEVPVIGSFRSANDWLLITTDRVIWCEREDLKSIPSSAILSVSPSQFGEVNKQKMCRLLIRTLDFGDVTLDIEEGPPFFGIWNVLKNFATRNKRKDESGRISS